MIVKDVTLSSNSEEKTAQDYMNGLVTLSEAADQAGITLWEMESFLIQQGFKSEYSIEDLDKEMGLLEGKE